MAVLCAVTSCTKVDDGFGRATASPLPTRSPSLRAPSVIPEVLAEPKLRHSARSRGIHAPCPQPPPFPKYLQHPNFVIPCAVAESMPLAPNPHHYRSTCSTQTSSFRAQSRNPSPACQGTSQKSQHLLHSTMDTATSRSMTVLYGVTVCAKGDGGVVCGDLVCEGG